MWGTLGDACIVYMLCCGVYVVCIVVYSICVMYMVPMYVWYIKYVRIYYIANVACCMLYICVLHVICVVLAHAHRCAHMQKVEEAIRRFPPLSTLLS